MISEAQSVADFQDRGITRAGELYLPVREALVFVSHCDDAGLAVIGAEAFTVRGEHLEPHLDLIADASRQEAGSWKAFRQESNQFVRSFLNELARDGLVINLTVLSRDEWA